MSEGQSGNRQGREQVPQGEPGGLGGTGTICAYLGKAEPLAAFERRKNMD